MAQPLTRFETYLPDEAATEALGAQLAQGPIWGTVIYLLGELGAGKTCFSRGWLRGLGYQGRVKSPTYTLVEPYALGGAWLYHFDLYRLKDPEELEFMGIRDYFGPDSCCLIEWPQLGAGHIAPADLEIRLSFSDQGRSFSAEAFSPRGQALLAKV